MISIIKNDEINELNPNEHKIINIFLRYSNIPFDYLRGSFEV